MAQEIRDVLVVYHTRTPCALLQGMVKRGDRGFSTGKGFYDWGGGGNVAALKTKWADKLKRILAIAEEE